MKKVKITARREITFSKVVEVTEEDYQKIKNLDYSDVYLHDFEKFSVIENCLDGEGVEGSEFEDVTVKIIN